MHYIDGEVFTEDYLDGIVEEINASGNNCGRVVAS
jgi:hypothetical protein